MNGARIAVLGAARSGIALALAAKRLGAIATVYDKKPASELANAKAALEEQGIALRPSFEGPFRKADADLLVTSPGVDSRSAILQKSLKNGVEVIGEIEFAYRISRAPIIAVTGTNGKSTTTLMTWLCLKAMLGEGKAKLCGNIYGSGYEEMTLVEAAETANAGDVLVAEISSFQLEWVDQFRPRCAAITNITPDHLNRYDRFQDYAETKRRIYKRMGKGDTYVHHHDPMTAPPASAAFNVIETDYDQDSIRLEGFEISTSDLPFHEAHNIANAAIAASLAISFVEQISESHPSPVTRHSSLTSDTSLIRGLQSFTGLAHRMESLGCRNGIKIINNSMCTNPGALVASSNSIPAHQHLLIGGVSKDLDFSPVNKYVQESGHDVYLFGADALKINAQLGGVFPVFRTMEEAFQAAIRAAKPGEIVMLAPGCASQDQFQDFRARGDEFRSLAKEWLNHEQSITR